MAKDVSTPPVVEPGDVLDERYRIERQLGRGGMGVVFAAEHLLLRQRVAVKILIEHESAEAAGRFAREAQVAAKLTSPHATRVFDVATPAGRPPYLVMELLAGRDLATVVAQQGPLPVAVAVGYVLEACDALAEAHALGIVHRDLKPANLFLARQSDGSDQVKVLDFGLSKLLDPLLAPGADVNLSTTSAVMGSPAYMSPEQLRSTKRVDARADLWSLGVVLYELLTAASPFEHENLSELLICIASEPHMPLRDRRPDIPAALAAVIDRCLEKKPDARYADVRALARALAPFAAKDTLALQQRIERRRAGAVIDTEAVTLPADAAPTARGVTASVGPSRQRARSKWIIGAALVAGFAAALPFAASRRDTSAQVAPASAQAASEPPPVPVVTAPALAPLVTTPAPVAASEPAATSTNDAGVLAARASAAPPRPQVRPRKVAPATAAPATAAPTNAASAPVAPAVPFNPPATGMH